MGPGGEVADKAALAMIASLTIDTAPYQTTSSTVPISEREKMCYYRDISNPALQRFYSVLQAIALMENLPDEAEQGEQDLLRPYFSLEPEEEEEVVAKTGEQSESFLAKVRKRAIMKFKEAVGLQDDAVAMSEGIKVCRVYTSVFP